MSDFFEWAPTADRSTLERYATCPLSARLAEKHLKSAGKMAAVGNEAHDAISATIKYFVKVFDETNEYVNPSEIDRVLTAEMLRSRPDVQPEVFKSIRDSWGVVKLIHDAKPWGIVKHDGGDGDRSGQMAEDVETECGLVQVTSEIDFLAATASREVVRAVDWKTGWGEWSEGDVEDAFQMQLLSWLVFCQFPGDDKGPPVEEVLFQVYNTRTYRLTHPVRFLRRNMAQYAARVAEAAEVWALNRSAPISSVPAWPTREGCQQCDAAAFCTACDDDVGDANRSPETWLKILHATECKADSIRKTLAEIVHKEQRDITAGGLAFGLNKPKADRRPQCSLYEVR